MKNKEYRQFEMEQNGMQIILEFPRKSKEEESIRKEVREILSDILQEDLEGRLSNGYT